MSSQAQSTHPLLPSRTVGKALRFPRLGVSFKPHEKWENGYCYRTFIVTGLDAAGRRVRIQRSLEDEARQVCARINAEIEAIANQQNIVSTTLHRHEVVFFEQMLRQFGSFEVFQDIIEKGRIHFVPPDLQQTFEAMLKKFLKPEILKARAIGESTATQYEWVLRQFQEECDGSALLHEITESQIKEFAEAPTAKGTAPALATRRNRLDALRAFFDYARSQKAVGVNPVPPLDRAEKRALRADAAVEEPTHLSVEEAIRVMRAAEDFEGGCLVPFVTLSMFCGVRPSRKGELGKLSERADISSLINFTDRKIFIPASVAKTKKQRIIYAQPVVFEWLKAYQLPIFPRNFDNRIRQFRRETGLNRDDFHDVFRHTFCTMHVSAFRKEGDTAMQAGHSVAIQKAHYRTEIDKAVAMKFWEIRPSKPAPKGVTLNPERLKATPLLPSTKPPRQRGSSGT